MTDKTDEKVRENRLRRAANRQGWLLVKSRRRDPRAFDYGLYVLVQDTAGNRGGPGRRYGGQAALSEFARGRGMSLDEIETELSELPAPEPTRRRRRRPAPSMTMTKGADHVETD
jgi:hypothetical protein